MKPKKYHVHACALGKFTATTNPKSPRAIRRDYRTFDTREEAEAWATEQNNAALPAGDRK
jgi:hypothetical protein